MKRVKRELLPGDKVFVGIDMHKLKWHVTVRTADFELFSGSIPGKWEALQRILKSTKGTGLTPYMRPAILVSGCMTT